jgi:hypothetical protein
LATASAIRAALAVLDFNPPATAEEERSRALDQLGALDGELLDVEASYSDIESDTGILDFFRDLLSDDEELDDPVSHRAREDELTDLTGSVPDNLASWQAANAHLQQDLDAIVIGEIGDEPSRQIAKLAAAIGRQSWPDPDPSLEERRERVLEALDELDPFDFEIPNFDTDSQKGN